MRPDDPLFGLAPDGRTWAVHAPPAVDRARGRGALLGLAVGEALAAGELRSLRIGPVGEATRAASCLAACLMDRGQLRPADLAGRYVEELLPACRPGGQTQRALQRIAQQQAPQEAGRQIWEESGRTAAGNGSLARTVPIALFSADLASNRRVQSLLDSALTHFDPRCGLACAAFDAAVAAAVTGRPTPEELAGTALAELVLAAGWLQQKHGMGPEMLASARSDLLHSLALARQPDLPEPGGQPVDQEGPVLHTFRLAFWHLLHTSSFVEALASVVRQGGDRAGNGAVTGALLGAHLGEEAIPEPWRRAVLQEHVPAAAPLGRLLELLTED